jgi:DNA-binding SARP family transcriptional activator
MGLSLVRPSADVLTVHDAAQVSDLEGETVSHTDHATTLTHTPHLEHAGVLVVVEMLGHFALSLVNEDGTLAPFPSSAWRHGRAKVLCMFLLTRAHREATRHDVIRALWPRATSKAGSKYLSNAIWNLRRGLATDDLRTLPLALEVSPTMLRLRLTTGSTGDETACWIDAAAFERACRRARVGRSAAEVEAALGEALRLYRGEFLPEVQDEEWAVSRRTRLQEQWVQVAMTGASFWARAGHPSAALDVLFAVLDRVPEHVEAARQAMIVLTSSGQARAALALYRNVRRHHKTLFHSEPIELSRLADKIQAGHFALPTWS